AKGMVQHNQKQSEVCVGRSLPDIRICERKYHQQHQCTSQREQHEIPQPPVARGALCASFEEHQRTYRPRRGFVPPQQMYKHRHAQRRQPTQKPWCEKTRSEERRVGKSLEKGSEEMISETHERDDGR